MKTLMGDVTVWRVRACAACLVYPSPLSPVSFLPLGLSALPLAVALAAWPWVPWGAGSGEWGVVIR